LTHHQQEEKIWSLLLDFVDDALQSRDLHGGSSGGGAGGGDDQRPAADHPVLAPLLRLSQKALAEGIRY
jgi:hypothetical protein